MNNQDKLPTCDHVNCNHLQRLEYCEIEGSNPDTTAANVDLIEYLMYLRGDFERGIHYTHDGNTRYISRELSYTHLDTESFSTTEVETHVSFLHERNVAHDSDTYVVKVGWRPLYDGANKEFYETFYTIELWPTVTYATIDEYDIKTEQLRTHERPTLVSRPMTKYDHETLFGVLSDLEARHSDINLDTTASTNNESA